jgi:hypothetical protein
MGIVLCIRTRKKWRGPKAPQGSARGRHLAAEVDKAAYVTRRFGDWTQIGIPADHVVRRLTR